MTPTRLQFLRHKALAASVILKAIEDYQGHERAHREDAKRFFASDSKRPYGFLWICEMLDTDPEKIRMELNTRNLMHRMRKVRLMQQQYEEQRIAKGI